MTTRSCFANDKEQPRNDEWTRHCEVAQLPKQSMVGEIASAYRFAMTTRSCFETTRSRFAMTTNR